MKQLPLSLSEKYSDHDWEAPINVKFSFMTKYFNKYLTRMHLGESVHFHVFHHFYKGNNFYHFLFTSLGDQAFPKWDLLLNCKKEFDPMGANFFEFFLWKQILSRVDPSLKRKANINIPELLP